MSTLHVPGVDPARIECLTSSDGQQIVHAKGYPVASLKTNGEVAFYGNYSDSIRETCIAVMNAAIDHWRLTGSLFPEPKVEPVACVCGCDKPWVGTPSGVYCESGSCCLRANNVAQWNTIQAALKAAKK